MMKGNYHKLLNGRNYSISDAKISTKKSRTMCWVKRDASRTGRRQFKLITRELIIDSNVLG